MGFAMTHQELQTFGIISSYQKNWASSIFRYKTYLTPYKISGKIKFVILRKSVSNIYTYADRFICATKKSKLFYKSREDLKILFA